MNNTALAVKNTVDIWECKDQLEDIRRIVSTTPLTDLEFSCLVGLGRATKLDPFKKEIWAVKYKSGQPANIFIGKDGYSTLAKRDPNYESHQVTSVYTKDNFLVCNNEISHTYGIDRGELYGAYCIVKRKGAEKSTYVLVTMKEYNLHQGVWKDKPETMIKKVAEAQALRQAFDGLSGTYSDAEDFTNEPPALRIVNKPEGSTQTERLKSLLNCNVQDEVIPTQELCTNTQIDTILELLEWVSLPEDRFHKALDNYRVTDVEGLTIEQAEDFIKHLRKLYHDKQSLTSG